jgi:hypothetical protein
VAAGIRAEAVVELVRVCLLANTGVDELTVHVAPAVAAFNMILDVLPVGFAPTQKIGAGLAKEVLYGTCKEPC